MSDFDRFTRFLLESATRYHAPPEAPREEMWASIASGMAPNVGSGPPESDAALVAAAASYHEPPVTPHEVMWRRIEPAWGMRSAPPVKSHEANPARRRRVTRWLPAIAAASLVIGVAIGRNSVGSSGSRATDGSQVSTRTPAVRDESGASSEPTAREVALRYATVKHLGAAETLLASFRADADQPEGAIEVSGWARELLADTRLLIDTPVERSPRERALLEDLELVLAQIATLGPDTPAFERAIVVEVIERQGTLARLQAVAAPGSVGLIGP